MCSEMEFTEHLEPLLAKVEGALMALLLDPDGVVVASLPPEPPLDAEGLGGGYGLLVRELLATSKRVGQGEARTILLELEKASLIALPLKGGYSLFLVLQPDGNLGRGVFEAKKAAFWLEKGL